MSDTYLELARTAFGPSLRQGEEILIAGMTTIPPSGFASVFFSSAAIAANTNMTVLTSQRLVLTRHTSWTGKVTPETIKVIRELELADIRKAELRKNRLVLTTSSGELKLAVVKVMGAPMTPRFLPVLAAYLIRVTQTAQATS